MSPAPRVFDHDEARRRHEAGESAAKIARDVGVSATAVLRAVNPAVRARMDAYSRSFLERMRTPCRGGCRRLVWTYATASSGYCRACYAEKFRRKVQHGTETEYRNHGCRCEACTRAASAAKRRRRERSRVPCSHGCGTLVDSINRRDPNKPPECLACALRRIHAERAHRRDSAYSFTSASSGVNLAAGSCDKCDNPPDCLCLSYGRGLTATRVDVPYCPAHHPKMEALVGGDRVFIEVPHDP